MPSTSERQRRFMGMELAKKRAGKKTQTGMSEAQLEDFASKPVKSKKPKKGTGMRHKRGDRKMMAKGYQ